ncbi:MAG: hypothetical protein JOZ19_00265 [Rubrobacter sp.]|nr:hypothetical protein [Rubrobacter sp.]
MVRGRPNASTCDHNYPTLVNVRETGSHSARCLGCLTVGPERPSSVAAHEALKDLGMRNGHRAVATHTS